MGSNSSSGGGNSGSDAFVNKKSKVKPVKRDKFGYTKIIVKENPVKKFISGGGVIGAITKPIRKKTEDVNRKFYEEKVLPSGKSKYKNYEDYIRARGRGEVDAYGREIKSTGDGGGSITSTGQVVQAPTPTAPTTAEVTQVTATDVTTPEVEKEDDITIRKRRIKAKGRSPTILTGVTGVTGGLTLGKPSLLGR
jgi:hypothetical protein